MLLSHFPDEETWMLKVIKFVPKHSTVQWQCPVQSQVPRTPPVSSLPHPSHENSTLPAPSDTNSQNLLFIRDLPNSLWPVEGRGQNRNQLPFNFLKRTKLGRG